MIFLFFLLACNNASSDLSKARQKEKEGKLVEAFDMYVGIEKKYSGTEAARQADRALQGIYFKHAEVKKKLEPDTAIAIYEAIIKRWSDDKIHQLAKAKIQDISSVKVEEALQSHDAVFCAEARAENSRIRWQQYKQNYPLGRCLDEAEQFLATAQPRERELEEMKLRTMECKQLIASACNEYNLSKTTSIESICRDPNKAFRAEFSRLLQRKTKLLAENTPESIQYYETLILQRWDSVHSGLEGVCVQSNDYIKQQSEEGIDVQPLQDIVSNSCAICLEEVTDIRQE